jgi:voltage-dependent anion channel protein 2
MSSDFTPPVYGSLGKQFKDLFKKKYDFENVVKITNKTPFGLTLTTSGKIFKDKISGSTKGCYCDKSFGEVEGEVDAGSGKVWGKVVLTKLLNNAKFTLNGGFDPTSKDSLVKDGYSLKAEGEYRKDFLAGSGGVLLGDEGKGVAAVAEAAGVIGFDGLSVGGQVKLNFQQAQSIADYNVGAQYERKDFTATLLTENQGDVIRFSWFHKVSKDYNLGVELISDEFDHLSKPSEPRRRVISLASDFQLDVDTLIKAKANNFGEVSAVVEHRLSNPAVVLSAAAQFKAEGSTRLSPDKFGLSVSFGEC